MACVSYVQRLKIHRRLQFHGYQHFMNSENDIHEFLEVLENYYADDGSLTEEERSITLAGLADYHLRGDALVFTKGLPRCVQGQWPFLCIALREKYDKKSEEIKLTVPERRSAKVVAIKTMKSNYCKVPTFDVKLLESKMRELITTTDERTRVLLWVLFTLSNVCQMICMGVRLERMKRSTEDKLRVKRAEKGLIDQGVYELEQLEKEVDLKSQEILEEKGEVVEESKSRLVTGMVEWVCVFCLPLNHVTGLMSHYVKAMEGWRGYYAVVADVCCFVESMDRLGVG